MTEETTTTPESSKPNRLSTRAKIGAGVATLLLAGSAIGATGVAMTRPTVAMAPSTPVAIAAMPADSLVTIKGRVVELYGNRAIIGDGSGKTLVDLGRPDWTGLSAPLVKPGDQVTVQGFSRDGGIRTMFLVGADGKTVAVGRMGGHGKRGGHGERRRPPAPPASDVPAGAVPAAPAQK